MREPDFVDECYADKDLSLLKKLTLVIPTYNRNYYLSRCLWYHAHFPFGEIIVADSSPEEKKVVNRETVAKVREMFGANIRYLEYEPETEKYGGDIYRKWGDAVQHVETEYVIISKDKEFIIPPVLNIMIDALNKSKNCGAVTGLSGYIRFDKKTESFREYISWSDPAKIGKIQNCDYPDPIKRVRAKSAGNHATPSLLTMYRSPGLKTIYADLKRYEINDLRFGEAALWYLPVIQNACIFVNEYYKYEDLCMQRRGGGVNKKESSSNRYPFINEYVKEGVYDIFCRKFRKGMINNLCQYTHLSEEEIIDIVDEYIVKPVVLDKNANRNVLYLKLKQTYFPVDKIWYHLPRPIKQLLSPFFGIKKSHAELHLKKEEVIDQILEDTHYLYDTDSSMIEIYDPIKKI